ncbi:import motor subunit, mitochondrial [[Candida] railenensis]|uniref:Import motor subunit, mitochondrial n=1 Tax=[Candida] railenensis TaxID=45579 RepID=A0A9P0VYJ2_9ASCO|nr:import motor subunit, mitochondrial [[Candida] railenensis]
MLSRLARSCVKRSSTGGLHHLRYNHNKVIGIDLGTTNSAVAVVENNQPKILENKDGNRTTPSVVAFTKKDQEILVGTPAKRQAAVNPQNTFFATKRLIGRKFTDEEVQKDLNNTAYKIIDHEANGDAWLETTNGRKLPPSQISGYILRNMKEIAQDHFRKEGSSEAEDISAVVTVPAYFNDSQRQATKAAAKIVGLNVLRVINEPTAAALAYGIDKRQKDGVIAVFDLGGGTFDISILDIEDGVFEVRATNGNTHLGGEDLDIILMKKIVESFESENENSSIDLWSDRLAIQRIREAAEKCKIELSHVTSTEINIPFISGDKHIKLTVTEEELDEMAKDLIERTVNPVKKCIRDAELKIKDIDEVILVGGMTRMPKIRKVVEELFGKKPNTVVNPDEAVALGASIQGAILSGQIQNVVLLDVTPLSLGIETYGGIFSPLIPRNSAVPIKKQTMFSTAVDGQTGVEIRVYQGERTLVRDNKMIGNFQLSGIPRALKGEPQIAVSFEIDADGIMNVSATDKTPREAVDEAENNTVSIQVSSETGLTDEEIQRMIAESSEHSKEDAERRQHFENASRADILCVDTENAVEQFGGLMEAQEKDEIMALVNSLKSKINDIRQDVKTYSIEEINAEVGVMQNLCLEAIKKVAVKQQQQEKK